MVPAASGAEAGLHPGGCDERRTSPPRRREGSGWNMQWSIRKAEVPQLPPSGLMPMHVHAAEGPASFPARVGNPSESGCGQWIRVDAQGPLGTRRTEP